MPDIMMGPAQGFTRDTPTSAHHVIIARAEIRDQKPLTGGELQDRRHQNYRF
jgi:hypothetical protein